MRKPRRTGDNEQTIPKFGALLLKVGIGVYGQLVGVW
jgi:hypothetical protein